MVNNSSINNNALINSISINDIYQIVNNNNKLLFNTDTLDKNINNTTKRKKRFIVKKYNINEFVDNIYNELGEFTNCISKSQLKINICELRDKFNLIDNSNNYLEKNKYDRKRHIMRVLSSNLSSLQTTNENLKKILYYVFFKYYRTTSSYKTDALNKYAAKKEKRTRYPTHFKLNDVIHNIKHYYLLAIFCNNNNYDYTKTKDKLKSCDAKLTINFNDFAKPYLDLIKTKIYNELVVNKPILALDEEGELDLDEEELDLDEKENRFINQYIADLLQDENNLNNKGLYYDILKGLVKKLLNMKEKPSRISKHDSENISKNNINIEQIKNNSVISTQLNKTSKNNVLNNEQKLAIVQSDNKNNQNENNINIKNSGNNKSNNKISTVSKNKTSDGTQTDLSGIDTKIIVMGYWDIKPSNQK